jgi:hypothetical protein
LKKESTAEASSLELQALGKAKKREGDQKTNDYDKHSCYFASALAYARSVAEMEVSKIENYFLTGLKVV